MIGKIFCKFGLHNVPHEEYGFAFAYGECKRCHARVTRVMSKEESAKHILSGESLANIINGAD